jgi:hypothetical protein
MAKKKIENEEIPQQYEKVVEYDDCNIIWKYDRKKSQFNPYEVEVKYKKTKSKD